MSRTKSNLEELEHALFRLLGVTEIRRPGRDKPCQIAGEYLSLRVPGKTSLAMPATSTKLIIDHASSGRACIKSAGLSKGVTHDIATSQVLICE